MRAVAVALAPLAAAATRGAAPPAPTPAPAPNPAICVSTKCLLPFGECEATDKCRTALGCTMGCSKLPLADQSACAFQCEMAHGKDNPLFDGLLRCMISKGCMAKYPDDGECQIDPAHDGQANITSMQDVAGDWWSVRGLNAHYDNLPCTLNRWAQQPDGTWRDNVTYTNTFVDPPLPAGSFPLVSIDPARPGDILTNYTEAALQPQVEHWVVISKPHPEWMLLAWCGGNPVLTMAGALVVSAHRSEDAMPGWVRGRLRAAAARHNISYDAMALANNAACP